MNGNQSKKLHPSGENENNLKTESTKNETNVVLVANPIVG